MRDAIPERNFIISFHVLLFSFTVRILIFSEFFYENKKRKSKKLEYEERRERFQFSTAVQFSRRRHGTLENSFTLSVTKAAITTIHAGSMSFSQRRSH